MKQIPNIISFSRIILSVALLFFFQQPVIFFSLYLLCGLSDLLDGALARILNAKSELGAKLDSIADFFLFLISLVYVISFFGEEIIQYIPLLAVVFIIRIGALIFAAYKYRSLVMLHTWSNKVTGVITFFAPVLLLLAEPRIIYLVLLIAALSAVEEFVIHIISKEPDLNRRGLL